MKMPRPEVLTFAMKLLGSIESAQQQLTNEEIFEAFMNITVSLKERIDNNVAAKALAQKLAEAIKRDPNLVN